MLVIIGCGNLNRKDDGVGIVVAQRLQSHFRENPIPEVRVYDAGTGGMEIMFQARHAGSLILIDASVSGSEPGTIFKLPGSEVTNRPPPSYSLHSFRWDHALYAGQKIFGDSFPDEVRVYLVEASDTSFGLELSSPVRQAAEIVCKQIQDEARKSFRSMNQQDVDQYPSTLRPEAGIHVRNGNLYLNASLYDTYFPELQSVILMKKDNTLLILPVVNANAGGSLLKIRNAKGDRVIHAQEFCRDHGLDEQFDQTVPVFWDSESSGLVIQMPASAYCSTTLS